MTLEVKDLAFSYRKNSPVFRSVNFSLRDGDILSVLGANGIGKSTLLNCLAGLFRPSEGDILLNGQSIYAMSRAELARQVGYVPQLHGSSFAYSVLECAVMGRAPYIRPYASPSKADYDIARDSLRRVGLAGMENRIFTELSGGEQQLTVIARVLAQQPRVILLDEPANHLDYGNRYRLLGLLRTLAGDGHCIITTTHDPNHVLALGGAAAVSDGGSFRTGAVSDIITADTLSRLYGTPIGLTYLADAGRRLCYTEPKEQHGEV